MENQIPAFISPEPEIDYATLEYEQQLQLTQRLKHRILHKLSTSNIDGSVPTDKENVELMLKVADSMDKTTLAHRKNGIAEKAGNDSADILAGIVKLINVQGNSSPFVANGAGTETVAERTKVAISELGEHTHAPGSDFIGLDEETSEKFMERMDSSMTEEMDARSKELGLT